MTKPQENMSHEMRFSVRKTSNSAALIKAKKLEMSFKRFCQIELTLS